MKLTQHQISKIKTKLEIAPNQWMVRIDVSSPDVIDEGSTYDNIYLINEKNEIIWQVYQVIKHSFERDPFGAVCLDEKGNIIAARYTGYEYQIDPKTGEAKRTGFYK